jgi:hypothetical protein
MTTIRDANRLRLCLCCGRPDARLLRLRDGRNVRSCDRCLSSCEGCRAWASGAVERKPLACEMFQGDPMQLELLKGYQR